MISGGISEIKCDRCGTTYDFHNDITSSVMDAIDEIKEYGWTVPDIDKGGPIFGTMFDCYLLPGLLGDPARGGRRAQRGIMISKGGM